MAPGPAAAQVAFGVSVNVMPPALPAYAQPPLPGPGYIWTPGYWGWANGAYHFHGGYRGPTVGFYGGVNYGFGYAGAGFFGGQWRGGQYFYNSSVNNVRNVNVTNVYNRTVVVNQNGPRASFNGGPNGIAARPTPAQLAAAHAPHVAPTPAQIQHVNLARADPQSRFSANYGAPPHPALARPIGPGGGHPGAPGAGGHPGVGPGAGFPAAATPRGGTRPGHMGPGPMMARRPPPRMAMTRPGFRPGPRPGGCRGPRCR